MLLAATAGVSVGIFALPFYTAGVFVRPLEAEFGWTREQIAFGALASTLTLAFVSPLIGFAVDRLGARRPAVLGLLGLSIGFFLLGRMQGPLRVFIGLQFLIAVVAALALGFALGAEVDLIGYLTARYFGLAA